MGQEDTSADEFDLKKLFLDGIIGVKRNFLQFLFAFIIGTILGYAYSITGPKSYESKMVVSSDILNIAYVDALGENLDDIINDGNLELLSQNLNISLEDAKKLKSIKLELVEKGKDLGNYLAIEVNVSDNQILQGIQSGLIGYMENNEYVKVRVEQRKKTLMKLITKVDEEILSLEKFKTDIYGGDFLKKTSGNLMFDPTIVNSKVIQLLEMKIGYQNNLDLANSVQVVEGFTAFNKPSSPKKIIAISLGASLGVLLVVLVITIKAIRLLVEIAEQERKKTAFNGNGN
jgi:hypothetical protein